MTLSTKSTTTSELPLRCCTTTLTMAYHHSHSRMLYLLPLLFLLLPHPCITAASWIIASLDYHCLFGPQPLFGLPRYFWITAVSTYQTKQSVTPISAFYDIDFFCPRRPLGRVDYSSVWIPKRRSPSVRVCVCLSRPLILCLLCLFHVEDVKLEFWNFVYTFST